MAPNPRKNPNLKSTRTNVIDTNKDGKISKAELAAWNKSGRPVDQLDERRVAAMSGYAAAMLQEHPELQKIINRVVRQGITDPNLMLAEIRDSKWFRSYLPNWLEVETARRQQAPGLWDNQVERYADRVKEQFQSAGAQIDDATARKYAEQMLYGSSGRIGDEGFQVFDEKWMNRQMAAAIDFTKTRDIGGLKVYDLEGTAATTAQDLYELAYQYGIDSSMTNDVFTSWFEKGLRGIVSGDQSLQDLTPVMQQEAMSRFPGLAQQLQRGLSLREAANPYLKSIAETLELDPNSLNLNDDLVQRILNGSGADGSNQALSLYDAKKMARRDERWQYTSTAKKEYTDMASTILKDFGFLG